MTVARHGRKSKNVRLVSEPPKEKNQLNKNKFRLRSNYVKSDCSIQKDRSPHKGLLRTHKKRSSLNRRLSQKKLRNNKKNR